MDQSSIDRRGFAKALATTFLLAVPSRVLAGPQPASIEQRLKAIIVELLEIGPAKVVPGARICEDLGADSLDSVELIMEIEEAFKIVISDEDAEKLKTVAQLTDYVKRRVAAKPPPG